MFAKHFSIALLFALPLAGACTTTDVEDELAGESAADGDASGKADGANDTFTYFEITRDYRRCVSPLCGGYWVSRPNKAKTKCADGRNADRCYVAELDDSALGFTSDADLDAYWSGIEARAVIVRGELSNKTFTGFGKLGTMTVTEAWRAGTTSSADGVWVKVELNGVRCFAAPCADKREAKLNSVLAANISELDFEPSGATDEQLEVAYGALTDDHHDGLIVVGDRYTDRVDGRTAKARTVTQFYTRMHPTETPTQGDCAPTGCSGTICSDEPRFTTCIALPEHACWEGATCERQASGDCGWNEAAEISECVATYAPN